MRGKIFTFKRAVIAVTILVIALALAPAIAAANVAAEAPDRRERARHADRQVVRAARDRGQPTR